MKHNLMSIIESMCGLRQYFWRKRKEKNKKVKKPLRNLLHIFMMSYM